MITDIVGVTGRAMLEAMVASEANPLKLAALAEIGRDMSRFPSDGHLVSWVGLCPGNDESASKRRSSRLRKGAPWLKTLLVQCAAATGG